ncbi:13108_t:CDS:10, partial [Funneliformis caledonium]
MSEVPTMYHGRTVLVTYLKKRNSKSWSYADFLTLNHAFLIDLPPYNSKWNTLNSTWTRRFMQEVKELSEDTVKEITVSSLYMSQPVSEKMKDYWEKIILERKEWSVKRTHLSGSLDLLDDAGKHNIQKLRSQGFNEEKEEESSTKKVRERKPVNYYESQIEIDSSGSEYQEKKSTDIDDDRILDEQMAHFDRIFCDLNPEKMWTLKSGRIVKKIIYEYAKTLKYESYLHSFIISNIDEKVKSLFQNKEWKEIFSSNCKKMTKIDKSVIELLKKYSVTDLPSFRKIIFESFLPTDALYFNRKHFDLNYVNLVYHSSKLEGWFQHNIWSSIIDPAFYINSRINLIRGEGMSLASSDRKNDTSYDADHETSSSDSCDVDRKKIGRKRDGIFRLKGDRLEFGAIEVGRKWKDRNRRKYITDILKLSKMLRDMLVVLIAKCKGNKQIAKQLQTVRMLHSGNRFQLLTMDVPIGYICWAQRLDFYEVAGRINDPPLAFMIKDAKAIIVRTLKLMQQGKTLNLNSLDDSDDDNKIERSNRCTTPPPMTLPSTFKTPNTVRTKVVINERKRRKNYDDLGNLVYYDDDDGGREKSTERVLKDIKAQTIIRELSICQASEISIGAPPEDSDMREVSNQFHKLYYEIDDAEKNEDRANRDLVHFYSQFKKALSERLAILLQSNPSQTAHTKLNKEAIEKDKILRIKSFTASSFSDLMRSRKRNKNKNCAQPLHSQSEPASTISESEKASYSNTYPMFRLLPTNDRCYLVYACSDLCTQRINEQSNAYYRSKNIIFKKTDDNHCCSYIPDQAIDAFKACNKILRHCAEKKGNNFEVMFFDIMNNSIKEACRDRLEKHFLAN